MPLHALELVLDAASDAAVRADWDALVAAGLPSQARHPGPTNAPHVTVASAARIDAAQEGEAARALAPLLPAPLESAGIVLLGRGPYAVARLLVPDAALDEAVRGVRGALADPHSGSWIAHVTLARRVPVDRVGAVLAAVATGPAVPRVLVASGLRRWNPDAGGVRPLVPAADPPR